MAKKGMCIKCRHAIKVIPSGGTVTCPNCGEEMLPAEAIQKAKDDKMLRDVWSNDHTLEDDKDLIRNVIHIISCILGFICFWDD